MEGLSVHRDGSGALVLTLISDDNFSPLQRTLLLQFTLVGMRRIKRGHRTAFHSAAFGAGPGSLGT